MSGYNFNNVKKYMNIIEENELIVIDIYYGRENGKKEKQVHRKFCNGVNQSKFNVFKLFFNESD
ncbi:class I SAM-dependent methyltransferase [Clostridium hydrogenum]|uniref:class I SAM-dependent methyltransferase n=1 Tax=Clostridium hydrogenum TaxID=2855764 RepID=UPI001F3DE081|nr:class I SAM-dependent methyltransferase [Clostridium hydrogenum]